jgi:hypothetical protein
MKKSLGPVSGYLDPEGRAWETIVFEAGKPVLDRELNLSQDIDLGGAQSILTRLMPSGWLSDDPITSTDPVAAIFTLSTASNSIDIPALQAHVNGWLLKIQHTNMSGANRVALGTAPASGQRTELVILEVWRRLLRASPNVVGKSASGRIWQQGNVATDPAADATINFADDTLDPAAGAETTARVQIQYRLRAIAGVDLSASLSGMTHANSLARSVPSNAATPNGTATTFAYVNQSSNGDPGLWRAGNGDPTNTLGTVDGYMYAIPLLGVFRRNSSPFARATNQNGAGPASGTSGRPDGYFHDIIRATDVVDLRSCVSPTGWALPEILEKNVNLILDNAKRTEVYRNPAAGGNSGTTVFMSNDIGGTSPQRFDAVRRRFSARPTVETCTVRLAAPAGGWVNNALVTLAPTNMTVYPYTAQNYASVAPSAVMFLETPEMHWAGTTAAGQKYQNALPYVRSITGLGAKPVTSVVIRFDQITSLGLTNESLFVTLVIAYPPGSGLTHTPVETFGASSFELTTAALSGDAPVSYAAMANQAIDAAHREVRLEYETKSLDYSFRNGAESLTKFVLPERATTVSLGTLDASGMVVTPPSPIAAGAEVNLSYTARRALPQIGSPQMAVYYRTAAPQMAPSTMLGTTLSITPRLSSDKLYSITIGAGSHGEGYPYPLAYVQTGGVFPTSGGVAGYQGEVDMLGSSQISVGSFDADTGLLALPLCVPMVTPADPVVLQRTAGDIDIENRTYFTRAVSPSGYFPNAFAQDLSSADRHKNVYPILAELTQDSLLGPKGQLVIVLFIRYAAFDDDNGVFFRVDPLANATSASVFRVKGLLLNKRVQ